MPTPEGRSAPATVAPAARIWLFAAGYFAAYVPYALLTKALTEGALPGTSGRVDGLAILPITTAVSAVGMLIFLGLSGLWRHARTIRVGRWRVPLPRGATLLSGACTAVVVLTTTLSYTFEGASIVTMMLLMRGGVLVIAPLVDAASGRRVRWLSWVALALSLAGVVTVVAGASPGRALAASAAAGLDAAVYLVAYFVRLRAMSRDAKSTREANLRFFAEEQMVATPLALAALIVIAAIGPSVLRVPLADGARAVVESPALGWAALIGLCSQGTGIFGALVLLDARENSFSVPVNRASSVLAGVVATLLVAIGGGGAFPPATELVGAGFVLAAILALAAGPRTRRPEPAASRAP